MHELRDRYQVGASPLREALNRLSSEEWVVHHEQRGFSDMRCRRDVAQHNLDPRRFGAVAATGEGDSGLH